MPTPFTDVYDAFLSQISDSRFIANDTNDALKYRYLINSISKFRQCKTSLARNSTGFNETLTEEEILILGYLMVVEYLSPQIISLENLKQAMGNKDFNITSQANQLDQLRKLRTERRNEANTMIVDYSYRSADRDDLR